MTDQSERGGRWSGYVLTGRAGSESSAADADDALAHIKADTRESNKRILARIELDTRAPRRWQPLPWAKRVSIADARNNAEGVSIA